MSSRLEGALHSAMERLCAGAPPALARAMMHAVFPGGARVRPRLCLAVAEACGDDGPELSNAAACALELMHCASLVHDDMPCFDNADTRRGLPSVHRAYGEALALLVGDGLIVHAFELIAVHAGSHPTRAVAMIHALATAAGPTDGIVAGQAWESEEDPPIERYHRAKTGALFVAATGLGALAAGHDPAPWRVVGERLGDAYQVADDLLDAVGSGAEAGKPVGRDRVLGRPTIVASLGVRGAVTRLESLVDEASAGVPACPGRHDLQQLIQQIAMRLVPHGLKQNAA